MLNARTPRSGPEGRGTSFREVKEEARAAAGGHERKEVPRASGPIPARPANEPEAPRKNGPTPSAPAMRTPATTASQRKRRHSPRQPIRLQPQALRRRGRFLDQRRVLLRHLVQLRHRVADLAMPRRLLAGGVRDLGDQLGSRAAPGRRCRAIDAPASSTWRVPVSTFSTLVADQRLDLLAAAASAARGCAPRWRRPRSRGPARRRAPLRPRR